MRVIIFSILTVLLATVKASSMEDTRGIADKRSDFRQFLPMKTDPARDGLKAVKPYFRRSDRVAVMRAIQHACASHRSGSSFYDPKTEAGYYINCNSRNQQLLNGYVPITPSEKPHSR